MDTKIKLFVVSHSPEEIIKIKSDEMYTPLFVGRNGKDNLGFMSDDSGDEISGKNQFYCELTGIYWMWKNIDADIIGLCHYRRYFKDDNNRLVSKNEIINYLDNHDIILPRRNYLIKGTYWENYKNHYFADALKLTREIVSDLFPDYLQTFDDIMAQDAFYNYNMFIADKELVDKYCSWIFPILNEVENRMDVDKYPRILGSIAEAIFNVWIVHNNLNVKEMDIYYLGNSLRFRMWISHNWLIRRTYSFLYKHILSKSVGEFIDRKMTDRYNKL